MAKKYVIDGREVIGWITRGGKRVPIFEDDDNDKDEPRFFKSKDGDVTGRIEATSSSSFYFGNDAVKLMHNGQTIFQTGMPRGDFNVERMADDLYSESEKSVKDYGGKLVTSKQKLLKSLRKYLKVKGIPVFKI